MEIIVIDFLERFHFFCKNYLQKKNQRKKWGEKISKEVNEFCEGNLCS